MQLRFRLARGLTVALAIVFAHFAIAWGFSHIRVPVPDLGPVFATLLGDVNAEPNSSARAKDTPPPAPKPRLAAPLPVQVVTEVPPQPAQ